MTSEISLTGCALRTSGEFWRNSSTGLLISTSRTSGLEMDSLITVIACWHQGRLHTFVEHENLDDFLDLLDDIFAACFV